MRPKERHDGEQRDLFGARLDRIVDISHPFAKLASTIDWGFLEQRFGAVYADVPGRPPLPTPAHGRPRHPQAHAQSFRRGPVRPLAGKPLFPAVLGRGVLRAEAALELSRIFGDGLKDQAAAVWV